MVDRKFWIFFLCFIYSAAHSQDPNYRFAHLTVDDGLSGNQVNQFLRDSKGFVWIATTTGLNRYDGNEFFVYNFIEGDSTSLVNDQVGNLFEDPDGMIWVSTAEGICIYDHASESFLRDTRKKYSAFGIGEGIVTGIFKDSFGNFWFLHEKGLYRYDGKSKNTRHLNPYPGRTVSAITEDQKGNLWVVYRNGFFTCIDPNTLSVIYENESLTNIHSNQRFEIIADQDDDLWIYTNTLNKGVFFFDTRAKTFTHIHAASTGLRLNTDIVRDIEIANDGMIWIATDHGGLNVIDKKQWTIQYVVNDPNDQKSLSHNTLSVLYKDYDGIIWIGTYKHGANYYHEDINKFKLYQNSIFNKATIPYNDVNRFVEDAAGNLWIGTNGGGLIYFDRTKNTFKQHLHDPANSNSVSSNVIVSIYVDHQNKLWIGTYFGGLDCYDGKTFTHFTQNPNNPHSIKDNNVWDILEDNQHNLWLGTLQGSLNKLDPQRETFTSYTEADGVMSPYITALLLEKDGSLWVGTGLGLSVLRPGQERFEFIPGKQGAGTLSSNVITSLLSDASGNLWVGTEDGLNVYNKNTGRFQSFGVEHGLPDHHILTLTEDDLRKIWVTTTKGIASLSVHHHADAADSISITVMNYDETDGLQGRQFNRGAAYRTKDGHLFFGGINGMNEVVPSEMKTNKQKPQVLLVEFLIDNNKVDINEEVNGDVLLWKSITETDEITLYPGYSSFSVEFTSLNFFHPHRTKFKYKLVGFDKDWVEPENNVRSARYTNINPGKYEFIVIASNSDGIWNEEGARLKIEILPPFWKSQIALFLYGVTIVICLFLARYLILRRERLKYKKQREEEELHRMQEMDKMKIRFFTNVSHEFRTPLTLILTPLESLIKHKESNITVGKDHLELIHRNARRLMNLVNQLLDFRRLEVEEVKLNPSEGDIVAFIKDVANSFTDLSEKKNIRFTVDADIPGIETLFDSNKMERIFFNLISNAFKFTPEGGEVSVRIYSTSKDQQDFLFVDVKDTGIGIPPENVDKVFDRFFQSELPPTMLNEGNGIGLSITKEFVRLHGGEIKIVSEVNKGTCFTISIPIRQLAVETTIEKEFHELVADHEHEVHLADRREKPVLLLVEDNDDFRFYLKDNLKDHYHVEEAANGFEGWQKVLQILPDMIVSDIMMPEMDGIELCKKIRSDGRTSHIPLILLTARSSEEQRLEGLETGADDYIVKPFSFEILHARIRNLIAQRAKFHKKFQNSLEIHASEINISSLDEILIANAIKVVEDNIGNPDFSVEEMSRSLGVSRAHLYRKLLALTGKSAVEFIRIIRLQRAAQLLEKSQLTVSEIAYQVGFNNPKYFTKYFKEQYKVVPSAYAGRKEN